MNFSLLKYRTKHGSACYSLHRLEAKVEHMISLGHGFVKGWWTRCVLWKPKEVDKCKQEKCKFFAEEGLQITIEVNKMIVDILDVTLELETGNFRPYIQPGNNAIYIDTGSNHPRSVVKAVPKSINQRLSNISSDEEIFNNSKAIYQKALKQSGFDYQLKY